MRPRHIPTSHSSAARIVAVFAIVFAVLVAVNLLTSCSPRTFRDVNKLAPEPPVYGERPGLSGFLLYTGKYLRDTEPLE